MSDDSSSQGEVVNTALGSVSGTVVQASVIKGGVHFHQSRRPVVPLPYRFGIVPPRAVAFQERSTTHLFKPVVERDDSAGLASNAAVGVSVVSGLGGVGKTQLVAAYAERLWALREVTLLVWVTANSRAAVLSSYASLAVDLTGIDDPDLEQGARRLMGWLATTSARWLIVFDDLHSPGDLRGLWPPATRVGRVVVTTRRRDAALRGPGRRMVEVGTFTPDEARAYLRDALAGQPELRKGAAELVRELDCLPIALAQAAAYLLDRDLTCTDYVDRWIDRRHRLASLLPESDGLPDEHERTVATTWSLSIEQANRLQPRGLAEPLLQVASTLNPNGIPANVFTTSPVMNLLARAIGHEVNEEQARDGLRCLRRMSLITLVSDAPSQEVRVHALVQRATRDTLPADVATVVVHAAANALVQVWPDVERDTALERALRANVNALIETSGEYLWEPNGHEVLFRAGKSLGAIGLVVEAREYYRQLCIVAAQRLGPDHPDTLTARSGLADWSGEAGDPVGAAVAFKKLLADRVRLLGPDHPNTLAARHDLAYWSGVGGDSVGAAVAFKELLADRVRLLGPDHLDTLITRHNFANWIGEAGDAVGAVAAAGESLADRVRLLGPDHPETLAGRNNYFKWCGNAGDPVGAAAGFEELLVDCNRVLGLAHPKTLITRHNLAHFSGVAGDPVGAAVAFEELLADRVRLFGPDHPDTLSTRRNLAYWSGEAGDPAGAIVAFEGPEDDPHALHH